MYYEYLTTLLHLQIVTHYIICIYKYEAIFVNLKFKFYKYISGRTETEFFRVVCYARIKRHITYACISFSVRYRIPR